ncbi:hypothetical protein SERLADRAFT_383179, partial [Serpula lacrymans var. lacrymans S7.9]
NTQPIDADLNPPPAFPEGSSDSPFTAPRPSRHRKLSQSNPNPRPNRKGIRGKMALIVFGITWQTNGHDGPSGYYPFI